MNSPRSLISLAAFAVASFYTSGLRAEDPSSDSWKGKPVVIVIDSEDLKDGRRVREIGRMLERAKEDSASALILEINVSGDVPIENQNRILDQLAELEIPAVTFVNPSATGPGALIALAGDSIYMKASGIIGGAGMVEEEPEDDEKESSASTNAKQQQSILRARARSLAILHGHRPEVVEAMVDGSKEVKLGEKMISAKGEVLTLTAPEAVQTFEGKPVLAKGMAASLEDLLKAESLGEKFVRLSPRDFGEQANRTRLSGSGVKEQKGEGEAGKDSKGRSNEPLFGRREEGSYKDKVVVVKVGQDTLATGKASFDFMDRTIKKAELDGAAALVFDMDTPGGFAWYTEGLVLNSLQNISFPTYTFVNSRAESAGAIVAVGTDHIYMRPAATIGSALVVSGTGQDLATAMEDKVTQMIIGTVRNIAELKGHNPDVAEAFVTRNKEVKIDGVVIHEAGKVLNLNTIRATEEIGGRPVLAKGVATSIENILTQESIKAEIIKAEPLGLEAFAHWVQKLSILLIVVGLAGAYMELNSPGFGLPGLVSVLAFSLFFFGNYLAGNLAGYELAVLLVLGLILIAVEVFLFPGAILPGAVGATLVLVALGLAMVDRVDLEWKWTGLPGSESWYAIFRESLIVVALGFVGALGAIFAGLKFLPNTRLGSRLILQEAISSGAAIDAGREQSGGAKSFVGLDGKTTTDLVPSGKGMFDGQLLDVVSDGQFIGKGESVKVTAHEGSRIVVEKLE
ncbi:MAG: NfeD family protein [Verrucomicrobiales bacterium]|nr:NfeD family protein [Verrucomicrobiales bacterium]